jgi:small subunit ribosomal protein S6
MNEYEIMLLLDPELPEERGNEIIQRLRDSVEGSGGTWDGHEPWGRRRLAYEIGHKGEAVYHLLLFSSDAATLAEITRVLKITDGVMRHLAVKRVKGGHLKAPSQIAVAAEPVYDSVPEAPAPELSAPEADVPEEEAPAEDVPEAVSVAADETDGATE